MRVVLDASAALEVALHRGRTAEFAKTLAEAEEVLAPDLLVAEVTNAVWKYHRFEDLDVAACDRVLERALGLVDRFIPAVELYREAFQLARTAKRPAYDMFYLALARREDAAVLTSDSGLGKAALLQGIQTV